MIAGKKVLVVEDEPLVAMALEDMLADLGVQVIGPAADAASALALLEGESVDAAVLDVNLGDHRSDAVADWLSARRIPFVLATGYGTASSGTDARAILIKPYRTDQLTDALSNLLR